MRKLIAFTFIILISSLILPSEDLMIRAFKVGQGTQLFINNRFTLLDISSGEPIILTQYTSEMLGNTSGSLPSKNVGYIVASYRVEGSETGSYKIEFDMTNFKGPDGKSVDCLYQLSNFNAVFVTGSSQIQTSTTSDGKFSISFPLEDNDSVKSSFARDGENAKLSKTWVVSPTESTTPTSVPWASRGGIGVLIDSNQFTDPALPYGNYRATVTVTLSSNG